MRYSVNSILYLSCNKFVARHHRTRHLTRSILSDRISHATGRVDAPKTRSRRDACDVGVTRHTGELSRIVCATNGPTRAPGSRIEIPAARPTHEKGIPSSSRRRAFATRASGVEFRKRGTKDAHPRRRRRWRGSVDEMPGGKASGIFDTEGMDRRARGGALVPP